MVVAGDHEDAACRRTAVGVAVLEGIAGPVDAGTLAVPDAEHAIDGLVRIRLDLLRAEDSRRSKVLVYGRQKLDVVLFEE